MGRNKKTKEDFIKEARAIHGNKYIYDEFKYIGANVKSFFICNKHGSFKQTPNVHLRGHGCPKCGVNIQQRNNTNNTEYFIEKSNQVHDKKYSYHKTNYKNNRKLVIITCPLHGDFSQIARYHLDGNGCPKCSDSIGELKINKLLIDKKIRFIRQKRFEDCIDILPLPFDFYLPDHQLLIEFDGKQHFESIVVWGGNEKLLEIQKHDKIKDNYAKSNEYKLLRIPYYEYNNIEKILAKI